MPPARSGGGCTEPRGSTPAVASPSLAHDAAAAVPLYRTNIFSDMASRLRRREALRPARVPVQLVVLTEDRYLDARVIAETARFVDDVTTTEIRAGHWSPRSHPDLVADAVVAFLDDRDPVRN